MNARLIELIKEILSNSEKEFDESKFSAETKLREDLNLDSFNLAELTVHIEDEFDVDIFENGIVTTLGQIDSLLNDE